MADNEEKLHIPDAFIRQPLTGEKFNDAIKGFHNQKKTLRKDLLLA